VQPQNCCAPKASYQRSHSAVSLTLSTSRIATRRYQTAGRVLEQLAEEAAAYGELKCQVWAVADAAWIAGIAGDKIDMERRLARLERLLTSPYLPPIVREEVTNKRLTAIEANRKLAMIPEVP
jgi:hypothetical protein